MNKSSAYVFGVVAASLVGCAADVPISLDEAVSPSESVQIQAYPASLEVQGPPTQEALALVWGPVLGLEAFPLPEVHWYAPTCGPNGRGFTDPANTEDCVYGDAWADRNTLNLPLTHCDVSLTSVAMAHELCHFYLFYTGQEQSHAAPCFTTLAFEVNRVFSANYF